MAQKEHAAQPPSRLSMESTPAAKLIGARLVMASEGEEEGPTGEDEKPDVEDDDQNQDEESDGSETETRILIDQVLVNTVEDPDEEDAADTLLDDFRLETAEALEDEEGDVAAERFMPQLDTLEALDDDADPTAAETILLDELAPMSSLEDEPAAISGEDPALIEIPAAFPDDDDGADDEPDRDLVIEPLLDSSAHEAVPTALH